MSENFVPFVVSAVYRLARKSTSFSEQELLSVSVLYLIKPLPLLNGDPNRSINLFFCSCRMVNSPRLTYFVLTGLETTGNGTEKKQKQKQMKILTFLNGRNLIPQTTSKSAVMQN